MLAQREGKSYSNNKKGVIPRQGFPCIDWVYWSTCKFRAWNVEMRDTEHWVSRLAILGSSGFNREAPFQSKDREQWRKTFKVNFGLSHIHLHIHKHRNPYTHTNKIYTFEEFSRFRVVQQLLQSITKSFQHTKKKMHVNYEHLLERFLRWKII